MLKTASLFAPASKVRHAIILLSALFLQCAGTPAISQHMAVVGGDEARKESFITNHGIKWYTSLEEAEAEAKKEGKMVFWMHMLGTMEGAT